MKPVDNKAVHELETEYGGYSETVAKINDVPIKHISKETLIGILFCSQRRLMITEKDGSTHCLKITHQ